MEDNSLMYVEKGIRPSTQHGGKLELIGKRVEIYFDGKQLRSWFRSTFIKCSSGDLPLEVSDRKGQWVTNAPVSNILACF